MGRETEKTVKQFEKYKVVSDMVTECLGNKAEAARRLEITYTYIFVLLKKFEDAKSILEPYLKDPNSDVSKAMAPESVEVPTPAPVEVVALDVPAVAVPA